MERRRERLMAGSDKLRALLAQFDALVRDPDAPVADLDRVQRQINRLTAAQTRLVTELGLVSALPPHDTLLQRSGRLHRVTRPMREVVLDMLTDLAVPAAPRTVSEVALAYYGIVLPVERFASLRRDEERAYRADPLSRPAWVVPALNSATLTPIARVVTNSAWPLDQRIIGSRTLRTMHLATLLAVLRLLDRLEGNESGEALTRLRALATSYADTVPGALDRATPLDPVRVQNAATAELNDLAPSDREERNEAARRLRDLSPYFQVWGRPPALDGGIQERSGS